MPPWDWLSTQSTMAVAKTRYGPLASLSKRSRADIAVDTPMPHCTVRGQPCRTYEPHENTPAE
jgi:hypothetical protein